MKSGQMAKAFIKKVRDFIATPAEKISQELQSSLFDSGLEINSLTQNSWDECLAWLYESLEKLTKTRPESADWSITMEYVIPVLRKRIDAVILTNNQIVVIEFKGGESASGKQALEQARAYVSSLQDFHENTHGRNPIPMALGAFNPSYQADRLENGVIASRESFLEALEQIAMRQCDEPEVDPLAWINSRYAPVPSIIEAAGLIFEGHTIKDLKHSKVGDKNITQTQNAVLEAAKDAKLRNIKKLLIITGVPGAGKTLAGLNARLAIQKSGIIDSKEHAAFLSGNRPLVNVLQEVIKRNHAQNQKTGQPKKKVGAAISQIIGHMHEYIEDAFENEQAPSARILIFDEAQRAWDEEKMQKWQKKKRRKSRLAPTEWRSEPETVLSLMNRHSDWAVVVILVGTGQEIHKGEAGMQGWGEAARAFKDWQVIAPVIAVKGKANVASSSLFKDKTPPLNFSQSEDLYLDVPARTVIAGETDTSKWVDCLLAGQYEQARECIAKDGLPVFVTRDLDEAKRRLRLLSSSTGKQVGLIASSGALRLTAEGVQPPTFAVMQRFKYQRWFLDTAPTECQTKDTTINETESYHSSGTLESAVSEFEIQGLELRIPLLLWGGDLIFKKSGEPVYRKLSESDCRWNECPDDHAETAVDENSAGEEDVRSNRISNKYRVLLTRFREALVVFVPKGEAKDPTRSPEEFDSVYNHFIKCGATDLVDTSWPK
jgi:hypothetical protein